MLSKGQRTYLETGRKELVESIKNSVDFHHREKVGNRIRKADYDIKKKTKTALSDLALIAEYLPEDQKEQIFTKNNLRPFIKAVLKDGNSRSFRYEQMPEAIMRSNSPEQIYNKRIFDLGVLFADFGIDSAYYVISLKPRIKDLKRPPTKGEMLELIDILDGYGYVFEEKDKKS